MSVLYAILQGIVQGITEFLPVSSNGHLVMIQHITGMRYNNLFVTTMLHIGTLIALIMAYYKIIGGLFFAFFRLLKKLVMGKFRWKEMDDEENMFVMLILGMLPCLLLLVPLPFGRGMNGTLLAQIFNNNDAYFLVTGMSFLMTAVLLWLGNTANTLTENLYKNMRIVRKKGAGREYINVIDALCIGFTQMFSAIFPGLSAVAAAFVMGEIRGINRQKSLDYAFLLSIPSIIMASVFQIRNFSDTDTGLLFPTVVGMVIAGVTGLFSITFFRKILKKKNLRIYILYVLVLGTAVTVISVIEMNKGVNIFTGKYMDYLW